MNRDIDPAVQSTVHFYAAAQKKGKGPAVIITADPCKHVMDPEENMILPDIVIYFSSALLKSLRPTVFVTGTENAIPLASLSRPALK